MPTEQSYSVGERVRGWDPDYELNYEGRIEKIGEASNEQFLYVRNELAGPFEGQIVGLGAREWRRV